MTTTETFDRAHHARAPQPLALAWQRVTMAHGSAAQIEALTAFAEVYVRTLNALVLPDYLRGPAVVDVEAKLQRLSRPSLGVLAGLYRAACEALADRDDVFWVEPVRAGLGRGPATRAADALVELRNRSVHEGGSGTARARLAEDFAAAAREALQASPWLLRTRIVRVLTERTTRDGATQGTLQCFVGVDARPAPLTATWSAPLAQGALYLCHPDGHRLLDLEPFVGVDVVAGCDRLLLWKQAPELGEVTLVDDDSGHVVRHRPLHAGAPAALQAWLAKRDQRASPVLDEARDVEALRAPPATATLPADPEERVLLGRFELLDVLGDGGMAIVYRAHDRARNETCALKVMLAHVAHAPGFRERFKREVKAMRALAHPRVIAVDDAFELPDGRLCLRMPVLEGGTLADRVRAGGASLPRVLRFAEDALEALVALHEAGVVHRDIKPSNLLVDADDRVVVGDLGVVWRGDDPRVTRTMELVGTPAYLAPEQRRQGTPPSPAADVWSLALSLHEVLTGDERATDPGHGLEGPFGALLRRMGAHDPDARPTAALALAALRALDATASSATPASATPTSATPASANPSSPPPASAPAKDTRLRRASARWLAAVALVALAVLPAIRVARARCGDGTLDDGEACDDGNDDDGDTCTHTCTSDLASLPSSVFWMGFREAELDAGMHLRTPSRRSPDYLLERARYATPATPVLMGAFRLMKTEASRGAFASFLRGDDDGALEGPPRSPESLAWHRALIARVRARHVEDEALLDPAQPTLPIETTLDEAVAFCAWLGGALPAESQWEFAARGPGPGRVFSWGDEPPDGSPASCARFAGHFTTSLDPPAEVTCGDRTPAPVDSHPAGCTPEGICNLSGNVDEWVIPGPVRWVLEDDPEAPGVARFVAHLPGPSRDGDDTDLAMPCGHYATEDPLGLRTGQLFDCYHDTGAAPPRPVGPQRDAFVVVRGGNFDDSLPIYYQSRARYPYYRQHLPRGLRCAFPPMAP